MNPILALIVTIAFQISTADTTPSLHAQQRICDDLASAYKVHETNNLDLNNSVDLAFAVKVLTESFRAVDSANLICPPFQHRARSNYGLLLFKQSEIHDAIKIFAIATNEAIDLFPYHQTSHDVIIPAHNLAVEATVHSVGTLEEMEKVWEVIFKYDPYNRSRRIHKIVEVRWIVRSDTEVEAIYSRMEGAIQEASSDPFMKCVHSPLPDACDHSPQQGGVWSPLFAPYYHLFDSHRLAGLSKNIAALYKDSTTSLMYAVPTPPNSKSNNSRNDKIHIIFVSAHMHNDHSLGMHIRGVIENISRDLFRVTIAHIANDNPNEEIVDRSSTNFILGHAGVDELMFLSKSQDHLNTTRARIAAARPDVIVYPEIGMDATTYFLAFSRLAKVQICTWGFPASLFTGEIDYFVSADGLEDANSDCFNNICQTDKFEEQLVRFQGSPPWYFMKEDAFPPPDNYHTPNEVATLTLELKRNNQNVYFLPQEPWKIHHSMDAIFSAILSNDPNAHIIMIADKLWKKSIRDRFMDSHPRIHVCGKVPDRFEFRRVLRIVDVILDTFPWGGWTTALQAIAAKTPIVTYPRGDSRSRFVANLYKNYLTRVPLELIAENEEDYAKKAVMVGCDQSLREKLAVLFEESWENIFETEATIEGWENFLVKAVG